MKAEPSIKLSMMEAATASIPSPDLCAKSMVTPWWDVNFFFP
jgi:hypothetical protein